MFETFLVEYFSYDVAMVHITVIPSCEGSAEYTLLNRVRHMLRTCRTVHTWYRRYTVGYCCRCCWFCLHQYVVQQPGNCLGQNCHNNQVSTWTYDHSGTVTRGTKSG